MLTPVQQRAILYNLPNLVADLDVFDVMDHLIATTPTCLTPTDYETISTTAHQKGRAAGVRCLVTCLLRRPIDAPVFSALCSALREQYGHLADLLERSLQQTSVSSSDAEFPVADSQNQSVRLTEFREKRRLYRVNTPCQNSSDFSILTSLVNLGFSKSVYDTIVLIITTVSSHPIVVFRWDSLSRELSLSDTILQQLAQPNQTGNLSSPVSDFPRVASLCRRALCLFFTVGLSRMLESHGSPFKRGPSTLQQNSVHAATMMAKQLVERDLIPAIERISCWKLASTVRSLATLLHHSGGTTEPTLADENHEYCALRFSLPDTEEVLSKELLEQVAHSEALLRACTAPLFNHSLINLSWPFVLRELHVCPTCILCLLHSNPSVREESADEFKVVCSTASTSIGTLPMPLCESALNTYLSVTLQNCLYKQERLHRKSTSSALRILPECTIQRICRAAQASVVHAKLLPVLRGLDLNALSDEIEQLALEVLH